MQFLVVEDEILLVMLIEDMLGELGHSVVCSCPSVQSALAAIAEQTFDAVFLDINLRGERAEPVAECLRALAIPFVIATGGARDAESLGADAIVLKPYSLSNIERAISTLKAAME